jgi:hypothetical protein
MTNETIGKQVGSQLRVERWERQLTRIASPYNLLFNELPSSPSHLLVSAIPPTKHMPRSSSYGSLSPKHQGSTLARREEMRRLTAMRPCQSVLLARGISTRTGWTRLHVRLKPRHACVVLACFVYRCVFHLIGCCAWRLTRAWMYIPICWLLVIWAQVGGTQLFGVHAGCHVASH